MLGYAQTLFIDRVSSGAVGNIFEQILGTVGTRNNNELATNALIEYCIVQGYNTVVFGETDGTPFVNASSDTTYNAGGKQVLTDIIARLTSAGITVGISITGESLSGYKRIAEYNATCASYEIISEVHIKSNWDNLSGSKTVFETMRDRLVEAVDDGAGGSQVNWTAAGGRLPFILHIGNARHNGDVFADGAIAYDQLINLGAALNTQFQALSISPFPTLGNVNFPDPTWIYQPFIYAITSYDPIPTWDTMRQRAWELIDDTGLFFNFYDTVGTPGSIGMLAIVSPETPVSNTTNAYDATKYYAGYFFEGRAIPGSAPLTDPAVVRNKKDAYDAFIYMAYDVSASIAECANPFGNPFVAIDPPIPRDDSVGAYYPHNAVRARQLGDWRDSIASRLPMMVIENNQSSTPYEDISSTGVYAYGLEKAGLAPPPIGSYGGGQTVWTHMNFSGIIITSQYVMRKYTDSLPHGPVALDIIKYNAAATPDYIDKYTPSAWFQNLGGPPYGGAEVPFPLGRMQIPFGTTYFPLFNGGAYSSWFFNINDKLAIGTVFGFRLQQGTGNYYNGATYTNPNNIYTTFSGIGGSSGGWGPEARFVIAQYGKALGYNESIHGTDNCGIGFGIMGNAFYFHPGFYVEFLPEPVIVGADVQQEPLCAGTSTGIVEATIISGSVSRGPMTYQWYIGDPAAGGVPLSGRTNAVESNLPAGTYYVRMTAGDTITYSDASVTLIDPEPLIIEFEGKQDICNNQPIGAIIVGVSGGTGGYDYSWSGPLGFPGSNNPTLQDLSIPGIYQLQVTDENGCTATFAEEILNITVPPITLEIIGVLTTCLGSFVTVRILTPPAADLIFDSIGWSTDDQDVLAINVSTPGLVSVTGVKGTCGSYAEITVPAAIPLGIASSSITNFQCGNPSILGVISVVAEGGCAPYAYNWTGPNSYVGVGATINNLVDPGIYTLTLTDDAGGIYVEDFVLGTDTFDLDIVYPELICFGATGEIMISSKAGQAPFVFVMDDQPGGAIITNYGTYAIVTNARAGVYDFIVTDANGCVSIQAINVPSGNEIIVQATGVDSHFDANDGQGIITSVTGGSGTFVTYEWLGPQGQTRTGLNVYNLVPGIWKVTVTDDLSCTGVTYVTIGEEPSTFEAEVTRAGCCYGKLMDKLVNAKNIGDTGQIECLEIKVRRISSLFRAMQSQLQVNPDSLVIDTDPDRQPLIDQTDCLSETEKINLIGLAREICTECNGDC